MDMSGEPAELHMRTDANNLVTTAATTHLPEQKETIHMITQLRQESCSGRIDDLAHVVSADCLSDCLTKASAKPDALIRAVNTGSLPNVDKHPPFRELIQGKHKAYLTDYDDVPMLIPWICKNIEDASEVVTFMAIPVRLQIENYLVTHFDEWWYDGEPLQVTFVDGAS